MSEEPKNVWFMPEGFGEANDRDCKHGQLARACEICQLLADLAIAEKKLEIATTLVKEASYGITLMSNTGNGREWLKEANKFLAALSETEEK